MLKQSLIMSLQNIIGNKIRSFLTMLGIIIGVAAVIALITTVSGATSSMMSEFTSMGAGSLSVSTYGSDLKPGLTDNDLDQILAIENVIGVSPSVEVLTKVVRNNEVSDKVSVSGKNESYFVKNDVITSGRPLLYSDMGGNTYVCVIDTTCANTFFMGENPLNKEIRVGGIQYTIIGVAKNDSNLSISFNSGNKAGGTIYIPYKNALRLNGINSVNSVEVYLEDTSITSQTVNDLEAFLYNAFNQKKDSYYVMNMESLLKSMDTISNLMASLLGGIASIALLVGGIGIMNMMLVSVTERTKEIGLRKALGAKPSVIQLQFLLESIILSITGGIMGIILGLLISLVASMAMNIPFKMNAGAILLGFGFSLAVGVVFGWAPARKASQLNPIDALRTE